MPGGPGWSGGREDYHKRGSQCNRGSEGLARQSIDDLCLLLSSPRLICLSLSLSLSLCVCLWLYYTLLVRLTGLCLAASENCLNSS